MDVCDAVDAGRERGTGAGYECHEGNYAMSNILSGARAEEAAAAEDARKGIVRAPRPNVAAETEQER